MKRLLSLAEYAQKTDENLNRAKQASRACAGMAPDFVLSDQDVANFVGAWHAMGDSTLAIEGDQLDSSFGPWLTWLFGGIF